MPTAPNKHFTSIYTSVLFLALHYAVALYIGSSYLEQFLGGIGVSLALSAGSLLNVLILLKVSKILERFGNRATFLALIAVESACLLGLSYTEYTPLALFLFIVHLGVAPVMYFNLDVLLETGIRNTQHVGGTRGIFLTFANFAYVLGPWLSGLILDGGDDFRKVFFASFIFMIPLAVIILVEFAGWKDPAYPHIDFKTSFHKFFRDRNLRAIFGALFTLQFFYSWMVIFMPLYLHNVIGFSWQEIGTMFSIMLLPFVLCEIPGGLFADKKGEKSSLFAGFLIMGGATLCVSLLSDATFLPWVIILFLSRIGASIIEIMIEAYFFKHVRGKDAAFISIFRTAGPVAFIIGPLVGGVVSIFLGYQALFFALGLLCFMGIWYTNKIEDTV